MARSDPHFRLRIPDQLKKQIEDAASKNGRSINAEIIKRLQDTLDFDEHRAYAPTPSPDDFKEFRRLTNPGSERDVDANLNPLDKILVELRKLQMTVSSIRVGPDGETLLVTEPKLLQVERPNDEPFPDPKEEEVLRHMAARHGFELTPKKDGS